VEEVGSLPRSGGVVMSVAEEWSVLVGWGDVCCWLRKCFAMFSS
jgi:hypothetical protein